MNHSPPAYFGQGRIDNGPRTVAFGKLRKDDKSMHPLARR